MKKLRAAQYWVHADWHSAPSQGISVAELLVVQAARFYEVRASG